MCVCEDRLRFTIHVLLELNRQMDENGSETFHLSVVLNIPRFRVDYRYLPTYLPRGPQYFLFSLPTVV